MIYFKRAYIKAFSLVELSIALAILGIMVSGGLLISTILIEQTALEDTIERIDEVNDSLKAFVQIHGRLPCPSSQEKVIGNVNYGFEEMTAPGDCNDAIGTSVAAPSPAGGDVYIGTVPVRRLGIPDKYMADAYGNRFIYAVTENLTSSVSFASTVGDLGIEDLHDGVITIDGGSSTPMAYVLISAGADGQGTYKYKSGASTGSCGANTQLDQENCDTDAVFRDRRYNDGDVDAPNYFDDTIRFLPKFMLTQIAVNGVDNLCTVENAGLVHYDEDAQRFSSCVATPADSLAVWRLLSTINTTDSTPGLACDIHHLNLVRELPDTPGTFQYCRQLVAGGTDFEWTNVNN